jgi:diguanylate cyclase (GGDEF)-like protein
MELDYTKELALIIDDDVSVRKSLGLLINSIGIITDMATSGDEAIDKLNKNGYTIVLTDMKMPGIDGIDLIKTIYNKFDVSIIAMTGFYEGYSYVDVINAGANDFIKKPFDIEELEAKIRRIITERNLRKELNRLSITDSLTELYNQRHFYSQLEKEIIRAERQKQHLSLLLLDLNNFKEYNDKFGHLAGDEVLRTAGEIIRSCIREDVDSGYRYGGDEFASILIDADLDIAGEIGHRIKNAFIENGKVTVSIGYSILSDGMSVKDLVAEADKDLYKEKNGKKNGI